MNYRFGIIASANQYDAIGNIARNAGYDVFDTFLVVDWANNPYSHGAYRYWSPTEHKWADKNIWLKHAYDRLKGTPYENQITAFILGASA